MNQLINKANFKALQPIISNPVGLNTEFINKTLLNFFDEADLYLSMNSDYRFWTYQLERTFLSMYLNGIVRNDTRREITVLQEYAVWTDAKVSKGRCDAFINFKGNAILIEAKRDFDTTTIRQDHWDIEKWLKWDDEAIGSQLSSYHLAQENYIGKADYASCQLLTLVFKLVSIYPTVHQDDAERKLRNKVNDKFSRGWFYTFLFDDEIDKIGKNMGLEIYGTIKTIYK